MYYDIILINNPGLCHGAEQCRIMYKRWKKYIGIYEIKKVSPTCFNVTSKFMPNRVKEIGQPLLSQANLVHIGKFSYCSYTPLHCPKVGTLTFVVKSDSVGLLTSTTYIMDLTTYRKFKNLVTSAPRTQTTWSELGGLHVFYFACVDS